MPKTKLTKGEIETRLYHIETALLDLALDVEQGNWQGVYRKTNAILQPLPAPSPKRRVSRK